MQTWADVSDKARSKIFLAQGYRIYVSFPSFFALNLIGATRSSELLQDCFS